MQKIKSILRLFKRSFLLFIEFNGMKLAAALSFYTVFSIGPLLIVIISLTGIFFGKQAVEGKVYGEIKGMVGENTALQIQQIILEYPGFKPRPARWNHWIYHFAHWSLKRLFGDTGIDQSHMVSTGKAQERFFANDHQKIAFLFPAAGHGLHADGLSYGECND